MINLLFGALLVLPPPAGAETPSRPLATDTWVAVADDALLCSHAQRTGQCARFRQPGSQPASGPALRVFRVVSGAGQGAGQEVELQAQYDARYADCGVLPAVITPLRLRVFAPARAVSPLLDADLAACFDASAADQAGPGRDPDREASRVAVVDAGAWLYWPDGAVAGQVVRSLWLQDEHGLTPSGQQWCATFNLGPDDGGAVGDRALDVCIHQADLHLSPGAFDLR